MIFVPFRIGERIDESARLAPGETAEPQLSPGTPEERLAALYSALAGMVAVGERPRVQAGDCLASLGVAAGLQRAGIESSVVWLDAHGDFNTWETTPSGFLGGMPLAMLAGLGDQSIVEALSLRPLPPERILLVGARDLDPGERLNLESAHVPQMSVEELAESEPPAGPIYVHLDLDVVNLDDMPAVDYPASGGPPAAVVRRALDRVFSSGRVTALSVTSWNPQLDGAERSRGIALELLDGLL